MKNYTIDTTLFIPEYVDALEKILTRLGWMPERDSDTITISVPCEDEWLYNWVAESDLF